MNYQIAEILNQPVFDRLKDWHDIGPVQKATLELFAKLIIEECIDYAFANGDNVDYLKQYFGVEE